ncbi:O-antigen ligase family protein [Rhodospira trueperi]|uniref:O-antigen ligase family protein n=1 Tax=Rhodospira trueperi TaxID=69960 RepID=UPI0015A265D0|nr:O-antigen ligase family protein [Rhodospira trueperi]
MISSSDSGARDPDPLIRVLPFILAAIPLFAVYLAGAFATATLAVAGLGGLWIAWRERNVPILAALACAAGLAGLLAIQGSDKEVEAILFAAASIGAVVCRRLPRWVSRRDLDRAATVFMASATALPVLLVAQAQFLYADSIPPFCITPDALAKPTFIAMALVAPAMALLWQRRHWGAALAFLVFMAILAFGSSSSTATLAYTLTLLTLVLAWVRPGLGVAVIVAVLCAPLVISLAIQVSNLTDWTVIDLRSSWLIRLELWQRALVLFEQAPLFGHGLDSFADLAPLIDLGPLDLGTGRYHPHAAVMQVLAEGGLVALVALALLLRLLTDRPAFSARWPVAVRLAALAAAVTPPAIGINIWSDFTVALVVYPWLICALFVAATEPDTRRQGSERRKPCTREA